MLPTKVIDRRIRHALRILENEQTPLPQTAEIAARVGLSQFHFVRLFSAQMGMSPQDYGRSLILMCAAGRLRYSHDPIETVAQDFGYSRQATFTKAFTRHHGVSPARFRRAAQAAIVQVSEKGVRIRRLPAQLCLGRRFFGPGGLDDRRWADMLARLPPDLRGRPRIGFAYDDPRNAPPARIRYDCAVAVEAGFALTDTLAEDGFELIESPAGLWAVADVVGTEVSDGYRAIFDGWFQRRGGFAMEGDPFLERRGPERDGADGTSVCVRVRRVGTDGDWNMTVVQPDATAGSGER